MLERLLQRHFADRVERPSAKRSAGSSQDNATHVFAATGAKRLENRVVFGIDRQHRGSRGRGAAHEQRAGADQTFLIRQRHGGTALGRCQRRP